jgi:hypothetical protein
MIGAEMRRRRRRTYEGFKTCTPIWIQVGAPEASIVKSIAPGPIAGISRSEQIALAIREQ